MKKLLAAMLGLGAFMAFAFQSPNQVQSNDTLQSEMPLEITLDGITDEANSKVNTGEFIAETE